MYVVVSFKVVEWLWVSVGCILKYISQTKCGCVALFDINYKIYIGYLDKTKENFHSVLLVEDKHKFFSARKKSSSIDRNQKIKTD